MEQEAKPSRWAGLKRSAGQAQRGVLRAVQLATTPNTAQLLGLALGLVWVGLVAGATSVIGVLSLCLIIGGALREAGRL